MKKIVFLLALVLIVSGCGTAKTTGVKIDNQAAKTGEVSKTDPMADVCNYFPKELIEQAIGKPVFKTEKPLVSENSCFYYTIWAEDYDYSPYSGKQPGGAPVVVTLRTEDLAADKADKEKTANVFKKDESIKMDNYVVYNNAKQPWQVMLIFSNNRYFEFHFVHSAVTGDELVKIAAKFAEKIQGK